MHSWVLVGKEIGVYKGLERCCRYADRIIAFLYISEAIRPLCSCDCSVLAFTK